MGYTIQPTLNESIGNVPCYGSSVYFSPLRDDDDDVDDDDDDTSSCSISTSSIVMYYELKVNITRPCCYRLQRHQLLYTKNIHRVTLCKTFAHTARNRENW